MSLFAEHDIVWAIYFPNTYLPKKNEKVKSRESSVLRIFYADKYLKKRNNDRNNYVSSRR